jgi:hypothetical protein
MIIAAKPEPTWSRAFYLLTMGGGAALSMVRGFLVAALLAAADFGVFAIFIALVAFSSPLVGLGRIEECRKRFPRLAADGHAAEIPSIADQLMLLCTGRTAAIAAPFILIFIAIDRFETALMAFSAALLLAGTAWVGILSSALRSGETVVYLGVATLLRAVAAFLIVGAGTYAFGLKGALLGEAIAAFAAGAIMRAMVAVSLPKVPLGTVDSVVSDGALQTSGVSSGGLLLFAGWMMASVPAYLNRPVVAALYDPQIAGTFAFLGLLMAAAMTGFAITEQISGPMLVRMQHQGLSIVQQAKYLLKFIGFVEIILVVFLILMFFMINLPMNEQFFHKYNIGIPYFLPVSLLCLLLASPKIDWIFISQDREIYSAIASMIYFLSFIASCIIAHRFGFSFAGFLWALTISKVIHIAAQGALIFRIASLT